MSTTDDALTENLIGRADIDDLEAILAVTNTDRDEVISVVADNSDAIFTWDYEKGARPPLEKLYEKAKVSMWNGETDLPGTIEVDQEQVVIANAEQNSADGLGLADFDVARHAVRELGRRRVDEARHREPELDAQPVHAR